MIDFSTYLKALPHLHSWDGGRTWNHGGFGPEQLRTLYEFCRRNLPVNPRIIETGAGNSTICFLQVPGSVVSIAPDADLFERIRAFCDQMGIPTTALSAVVEGSEWALPEMAKQAKGGEPPFDFALIDGCHNWPMVMVDFCYMNFLVKKGGFIMLDDIQLHSVKELARMLTADTNNFSLACDMNGKSLIFKKTTDRRLEPEWNLQPYLLMRSQPSFRPFALNMTIIKAASNTSAGLKKGVAWGWRIAKAPLRVIRNGLGLRPGQRIP